MTVIYSPSKNPEESSSIVGWHDFLVLSGNIENAGDYKIFISCFIGGLLTTEKVGARIVLDGVSRGFSFIPQFADQFLPFTINDMIYLSAGSHEIKIQYGLEDPSQTAKMKWANILVEKH